MVSHGFDRHSHAIEYDHLVLGLGSITNFFNLPGLAERALTMKSFGDAIQLRNRLIAHLEEADTECAKADRQPLLTFVVAGGGFAGVETIASINDFLRDALPFYPNLREEMLRVVLVHPGEYILPEIGEKLGRYADKKLRARGVEIHAKTKVTAVTPHEIELSDGERIYELHARLDGRHVAQSDARSRAVRERTRTDQGECESRSGGHCLASGRSAIARSFPISEPASFIRRPRNTLRGKEKFSRKTSSRACVAEKRSRSVSRSLGCSPRSAVAPVSRESSASTFRVSRLVALARNLLEQTAAHREEDARRDRLGARCLFLEGFRAIPRSTRRCIIRRPGSTPAAVPTSQDRRSRLTKRWRKELATGYDQST